MVGVAAGLSGVLAPYEGAALEGAKIAVAEINAKGGVLGRELKLVTADTRSDINASTTAGQEILSKGADVVLTSIDLNFGGGTASVVQAAGKVAMSIGGGSAQWAKFGPQVFSLGTPVGSDSAVMAQWAKSKGHTSTYLLIDTSTDYSKDLCDGYGEAFKKAGGTVLGADTFGNGDSSLASQVTRIKALPQAPSVIALCSYPPGGALAVKSLRNSGVEAPILSGSGMAGDFWFKKTMPHLNGVYTVDWASVWGDDPSPEVNALTKKFRDSGIDVQNSYGVMGYVGVQALTRAITDAKSTDGQAVAGALNAFNDVKVPIGLSFTKDAHLDASREYRVIGIQDGTPRLDGALTPQNSQ
ncbi:ABC transporter substrate-binding protein [Planotetraspora sp. GP83]|uniref:ABC transporter substrate-binding protein n=1 Tax=Planotetraspora sp. GP83 TaxID=3156264 RepID=UPI0035163AB7